MGKNRLLCDLGPPVDGIRTCTRCEATARDRGRGVRRFCRAPDDGTARTSPEPRCLPCEAAAAKRAPPAGPVDALFFLRHSRHGDAEIRYALRGIARHMPWVRRVIVFGDRPAFLADEPERVLHVPHEAIAFAGPYKTPVTNFFLLHYLASLLPELAEDYVWFCDDFVPIADVTPGEACRPIYSNDLAKSLRSEPGHLWRDSLWRTHDTLKRLGYPSLNYEPHVPTYFRKRWVLDAFRDFRGFVTEDRWYGMLGQTAILNHAAKVNGAKPVSLASVGGKAAWYGEPPTYDQVAAATKGRRYLNFDDGSFGPGIRRWLAETFPEPCRFERPAEMGFVPHRHESIKGWFDADFEACYRAAAYAAWDGASFVEIGSYLGKSTAFLATELLNISRRATLTAVDTWRGTPGRMKRADYFPAFTANMRRDRDLFEIVTPIRSDSSEAAAAFPGKSIDFLFVDGDHSYEGISRDLAAWRTKVRGVIAGHDYDPVKFPGVVRAVTETFGEATVRGTTWAVRIGEPPSFETAVFFDQFAYAAKAA